MVKRIGKIIPLEKNPMSRCTLVSKGDFYLMQNPDVLYLVDAYIIIRDKDDQLKPEYLFAMNKTLANELNTSELYYLISTFKETGSLHLKEFVSNIK